MRNFMSNSLLVLAASLGLSLTTSSQAAQILLDGEGDSGTTATDKLTADGAQDPTFLQGTVNGVIVDNTPANAAHGSSSFQFQATGGDPNVMNRLMLPGTTSLGSSFTLAAMVKGSVDGRMELFSSYLGGNPHGNIVRFEVNAGGDGAYSRLRFAVGPNVDITTSTWGSVSLDGNYHHVAVTFDNGIIKFYRDGVNIESYDESGTITSFTNGDDNIYVGNNTFTGPFQLAGSVDDILVYDRALTGAEIENIRLNGAITLVPEPSVLGVLALAGCGLAARRRR